MYAFFFLTFNSDIIDSGKYLFFFHQSQNLKQQFLVQKMWLAFSK